VRDRVETATEAAAQAPWSHLGPAKLTRLEELGRDLTRRVVAAGAFPKGVFAQGRA
jgi:hypothetical protein